jgi:hypothetical protein
MEVQSRADPESFAPCNALRDTLSQQIEAFKVPFFVVMSPNDKFVQERL